MATLDLPLVVLTGPRPPRYSTEFDPETSKWWVLEDGVPVIGGLVEDWARHDAGRITNYRWRLVMTGQSWPAMDDPIRLPARYLVIPPPPARPQLWSRN